MFPSTAQCVTIVILGASGDLAKKKTFPALFHLYQYGILPSNVVIIGFARSSLSLTEFRARISSQINVAASTSSLDDVRPDVLLNKFLDRCDYISGSYENQEDYKRLLKLMKKHEESASQQTYQRASSAILGRESQHEWTETVICGPLRIFYLALPPHVFVPAADGIQKECVDPKIPTRLVVEKPFGRDLETSSKLSEELGRRFSENQIYRIDHYLGKEMVKNLIILRFANMFFYALWNASNIASVQITFKEKIGVEGRGGYFDSYGIIRDVMQNHLLQIMSIIAMKPPNSLSAEDVRNEKVKVLNYIRPLTLDDIVVGQYGPSDDGKVQGYLQDPSISKSSITPTFAVAVLTIANPRWKGVPFILKCGKALNEHKAEIRIQFEDVPHQLFKENEIARNELVVRVQPNEAVYMKMMVKRPGLETSTAISELDLSYSHRYRGIRIPDAYESLLLDILKGDHSNFVRKDELESAWKIFTPVLHALEEKKIRPDAYPAGSRGPAAADDLVAQAGVRRTTMAYLWHASSPKL